MNNWKSEDFDENVGPRYVGRKINKEKFCKRNKLHNSGNKNHYGPHEYKDGHCIRCNKIDPQIKFKRYGNNSEDEQI